MTAVDPKETFAMRPRIAFGVFVVALISCSFSASATSVRGEPAYPEEAIRDCIEGYVVLEYTLTEEGRAKDIVVIDADPPGIFEAAAIRELELSEFEPREVDGLVVAVPQQQMTFRFELEEAHLRCHSTHVDGQ